MATESQMDVLQVTANFAPHVGGVETHVREVVERLPRHAIRAEVLTADASHALAPYEVISGTPVRRLPAYPRNRDWMLAPSLGRAIRAGSWDLVHVQSYHTLFAPAAMAAAARARIPYVVTFHSGGSSSLLRRQMRATQMRGLRPLLRRARALIAVSEFERSTYAQLLRLPDDAITVIPNGAAVVHNVEPIAADGRLIISLGRLERYKGHDRAIAALPTVLEAEADARLWIAGSGPDEARLRRLARDSGLGDRVEIGAADHATLIRRLSGASLMVLLSDFEAQGIAILEAASLGVPALVADNSGMSELARAGFASSVDLAVSSREHGLAMLAAMSRTPPPDLRIPTWDDCARSLAILYAEITGRAAPAQPTEPPAERTPR